MSVRHALLALLTQGSKSTYQLRKDFEDSTGQTWPLNIGQVSTTLERLARDGFVERADEADSAHSRQPWQLTTQGAAELAQWWHSPVSRGVPERSELVIKLALAVTVAGVDVADVIQTQRRATLQALHDITRIQRDLSDDDLAADLVLEHHVFTTEAELRWLDHIEGKLATTPRRKTVKTAEPASALEYQR